MVYKIERRMPLIIALVMVVVFGLQARNRHVRGKHKVAPAQMFKIHLTVGVLTLVLFLVPTGTPSMMSSEHPSTKPSATSRITDRPTKPAALPFCMSPPPRAAARAPKRL